MKNRATGFTLIEILIYISIFAVVSGLMTGILAMVLKINQKESAVAETTGQLNFTMQTISRLVKESSNIDIVSSAATSTLRLRMKDSAGSATDRDPVVIWLDEPSKIIKMSGGTGFYQRTSNLTDEKVIVDKLEFTKFSQYPGHDTISVDIQFTYNSNNQNSRITRALQSAIARVSAATFDSDILPGSAYTFSIGQSGSAWQRIFMADGLPASPSYTFSNNPTTGIFASSTNALGFSTAGINRMIITNTGNVGIGTAAAAYPLEVMAGTVRAFLQPVANNDVRFGSVSTHPLSIYTGGTERIRINTSGNVGIGTTSPQKLLHLSNSSDAIIRLQSTFLGARTYDIFSAGGNPGSFIIYDATSGASRVIIDSVGNVSIGATAPTEKLTINGKILFDGIILDGNLDQTSLGTAGNMDINLGSGIIWRFQTNGAVWFYDGASWTQKL